MKNISALFYILFAIAVVAGLLGRYHLALVLFLVLVIVGIRDIVRYYKRKPQQEERDASSPAVEQPAPPVEQAAPAIEQPAPAEESEQPDPRDDNGFFCKIAGITHHATLDDIGGFLGYAVKEPHNRYDSMAVAIYRSDKKLIGYLPKSELDGYHAWTGEAALRCIGFIDEGEEVPLYGRVKVVKGTKDEQELEVVYFVRWMVDHLGLRYVPKGIKMEVDGRAPRTRQELLDALDEYLSDMLDKEKEE